MENRPLIEWIVLAFGNLGGRAHLDEVHDEVRRLGYDGGGADLAKLILGRIYELSSDSLKFTGNPNDDLFRHQGRQRSGIWKLRTSERLLDEDGDQNGLSDDANFVPHKDDRRKVIERQIRERRGQQQFRDTLREWYRGHCLVTGCEIPGGAGGMHIIPYRGIKTNNNPVNGLLLRSDIHTLFDLYLLGIEPEGLRVELHQDVVAEYGEFSGVTLHCVGNRRPAREALRLRYEQFRRRRHGSP